MKEFVDFRDTSNLSQIPSEILAHILSFLTPRDIIRNELIVISSNPKIGAGSACRKWYNQGCSESAWKRYQKRTNHKSSKQSYLATFAHPVRDWATLVKKQKKPESYSLYALEQLGLIIESDVPMISRKKAKFSFALLPQK